jgi:uncharacterized membrane protein
MMKDWQWIAACLSPLAFACGGESGTDIAEGTGGSALDAPSSTSLGGLGAATSGVGSSSGVPCAKLVGLGEPNTVLTDIDRSGEVVVGYIRNEDSFQAFRWLLSETSLIELGDRIGPEGPLPTSAQATGVSADGEVLVGAWSRVGGVTAYRWTTADGYQPLPPPSGAPMGASTTAFRASADGTVIVGYANDGVADRAARWLGNTGDYLTDFPTGANGSATATAVSDDGRVIVGVSRQQAFRWSDAAGLELLNDTEGPEGSRALDVSANGDVVVGVNESQAFRYTSALGLQSLGDTPGESVSVATAVSADGQVVVGYRASASESQAVRWVAPSNVAENITPLLPAGAATGWQLSEARAVSGDGHVIGGIGVNPAGESESWIAIVPDACP